MGEDICVDGPNSVRRRILLGKGFEHGSEGVMVAPLHDDGGELRRVHHADDLLADGADVFSHCASSDSFMIFVEFSSLGEAGKDAEVCVGPLDPNEITADGVFITEILPMGPHRGLAPSG
jgi:hypothetical protein